MLLTILFLIVNETCHEPFSRRVTSGPVPLIDANISLEESTVVLNG